MENKWIMPSLIYQIYIKLIQYIIYFFTYFAFALHTTTVSLYLPPFILANHTYKLTERQEPLSRINFCKRKKPLKTFIKHLVYLSITTLHLHLHQRVTYHQQSLKCVPLLQRMIYSSITYPSLMMYNQLTTESDTELFNSLEKTLTGIT